MKRKKSEPKIFYLAIMEKPVTKRSKYKIVKHDKDFSLLLKRGQKIQKKYGKDAYVIEIYNENGELEHEIL